MLFLLNAFSINMLRANKNTVIFETMTLEEAKKILLSGFESAIGHSDTATLFSSVLGFEVGTNRSTVTLEPGSVAVVGQYTGPRLPEGCKTLPDGACIAWVKVQILPSV